MMTDRGTLPIQESLVTCFAALIGWCLSGLQVHPAKACKKKNDHTVKADSADQI